MTPEKKIVGTRLPTALLGAIFALVANSSAAADASRTNAMLDRLEGAWASEGPVYGVSARSDMVWDLALDGQFVSLDYRIVMRPGGGEIRTFSGVAYYDKIKGVAGFWADSRGNLRPIRVEAEDNALIAHWGVEGDKQGRMRYELLSDGGVEVTDWVLHDGEWRQINQNIFVRAAKKK